MIAFANNPDQWELYKRERPSTAVDEIVRWATPVSAFQRTALDDLLADGANLSPEQPQYYISTLPQLRVSLLGAAIKDAKARASAIAQSGGSSVGALETASSGVVQVLAPNSTNVEDYGQYDTSSIDKQVTVTVRANFYVQ